MTYARTEDLPSRVQRCFASNPPALRQYLYAYNMMYKRTNDAALSESRAMAMVVKTVTKPQRTRANRSAAVVRSLHEARVVLAEALNKEAPTHYDANRVCVEVMEEGIRRHYIGNNKTCPELSLWERTRGNVMLLEDCVADLALPAGVADLYRNVALSLCGDREAEQALRQRSCPKND